MFILDIIANGVLCVGVMNELTSGERSAKYILFHIFKQIVDFKKSDGGKASADMFAAQMNGDVTPVAQAEVMTNDSNNYVMVEAVPVNSKVLQSLDMNAPQKNNNLRKLEVLYMDRIIFMFSLEIIYIGY